jgi:hypothetical protein
MEVSATGKSGSHPGRTTGSFGSLIRELTADVVIDLICFTQDSAMQLVEALRGQVRHFLHCGTIWVHKF